MTKGQPVAKMLRHISFQQFKVVPPSFEQGLVLLATLIRGGGGSQAQDHGQAICAKIRYSVSSAPGDL